MKLKSSKSVAKKMNWSGSEGSSGFFSLKQSHLNDNFQIVSVYKNVTPGGCHDQPICFASVSKHTCASVSNFTSAKK